MPPHLARHKVRDIRSADRRRPSPAPSEPKSAKVVDLRAYAGRNVIRFPGGPTPAA
ncbi:hypothetical protein [Nonomuraea pusilla]|uniref:hypothetical protein n=1 Tax=Nonomuraea pusilla TaxID=46177 RepID=UPI001F426DEC|nr:hypothetical protein [Nonomuraea pusilla]